MSAEKTYYEILNVPKTATAQEIKASYRSLSRKYHPDKLQPEQQEMGTNKIKEINEAYGILGDPDKRQKYDMYGKMDGNGGFSGGFPNGFPGGFPNGFPGGSFSSSGFSSGFNVPGMPSGIFNFMNGNDGNNQPSTPVIKISHEVSLEDIYKCASATVEISRLDACMPCEATGYKNKKSPQCQSCGGTGLITKVTQMGIGTFNRMSTPCTTCRGSGNVGTAGEKCSVCNGQRMIKRPHTISFNIPSGAMDGQTIVIENEGNQCLPIVAGKITRANIDIIIREKKHHTFTRHFSIQKMPSDPNNLLVLIHISVVESMCGFKREITHLDGHVVTIVETDPIRNGDIKCIIGEGMKGKNTWSANGTLFVKYEVDPYDITHDQKQFIYKDRKSVV